jgi:hypothetical protein
VAAAKKNRSGQVIVHSPGDGASNLARAWGAALAVELLEDRLAPSGGPGASSGRGGSGPSAGSGGGSGSSNPPAITSDSTAGAIVTASSGKAFQLGALMTALSTGGMTISQLFSGYPLAPSGGPSLQGDLVTTDPSTVPMSMQNSTVAVVPVLLASAGGTGYGSYTLVLLDATTGVTYSVPVNMTAPTTTVGA